jgi:hypothetical protein
MTGGMCAGCDPATNSGGKRLRRETRMKPAKKVATVTGQTLYALRYPDRNRELRGQMTDET